MSILNSKICVRISSKSFLLVYLKTYPSKFPMPCKTTEVKNLFMPPAFVPGAKLGGDVTIEITAFF